MLRESSERVSRLACKLHPISLYLYSSLSETGSSIDTGIDYTHPLLGGAIGPGHKVIGGFDFVGDAYDGAYFSPIERCKISS